MRDLTIQCEDLTKTYGTNTPLTCQLVDNGTPLNLKPVVFRIHGVDYNRTTDNNGRASLNINLQPGTYPCTVSFPGDSTYNPTNRNVFVHVLSNTVRQTNSKRESSYFEVNKIPLHVLTKEGFNITMGFNVKETNLLKHNDTLNAPTFYFNSGNTGIKFEVSIVMRETYLYENTHVGDYLDNWSKTLSVVSVVTDAMDVPNGKYTVHVKSKKQTDKNKSIWKVIFKQFYENSLSFESSYTSKTSTYSAVDLILLKYQIIQKGSPKEAILALQQKLQYLGCFTDHYKDKNGKAVIISTDDGPNFKPRKPNGVWDAQMLTDISLMQAVYGFRDRDGVCDREVIIDMVGLVAGMSSVYDVGA